jgi:acetyl esterase
MAAAEVEPHMIPGGPGGEISITVVRPEGLNGSCPVVMYFHGGGWVLGDFGTYERLVRELAAGCAAAIVFVNYTLSPEAQYPMAIQEAFAATAWVARRGAELGLDGSRLAVAGDGVGGAMAAAVTLLAQEHRGLRLRSQVLFYPVTSAQMDTASYTTFAQGYGLTRAAMQWFWHAYAPDQASRAEPAAAPLLAMVDQLRGVPPALVITAEADPIRDEGEAYARKLHDAGVNVTTHRFAGTIHGFMMLDALAESDSTRRGLAEASAMLKASLVE